jgi:Xaa-Pro aminopeptidase
MSHILSLQKKISKERVDYFIGLKTEEIADKSILYLTDIKTDLGILIVPKKGRATLFVSALEFEMFIQNNKRSDFDIKLFQEFKEPFQSLTSSKDITIGMIWDIIPKKVYDVVSKKFLSKSFIGAHCEKMDLSEAIQQLRMTKTVAERALLRKAALISEEIIQALIQKIPTFIYEIEAVNFLKLEAVSRGCEIAFPPIVASGKHASSPHYHPLPKSKIEKGFCIIDFGVKYQGYCGDLSRTIFIGSPTKAEIAIYEDMYNNKEKIVTYFKPKAKYEEIFAAYDSFATQPLMHALGHGIGMQVHEKPSIGKRAELCKKDHVIAIEPGAYYSDAKTSPTKKVFGIRLEDNYIITENGALALTKAPKKLVVIKK